MKFSKIILLTDLSSKRTTIRTFEKCVSSLEMSALLLLHVKVKSIVVLYNNLGLQKYGYEMDSESGMGWLR